ncbi:hypothetical protein Moror_792, partial [Moniliophthora roreri MCA 2997]
GINVDPEKSTSVPDSTEGEMEYGEFQELRRGSIRWTGYVAPPSKVDIPHPNSPTSVKATKTFNRVRIVDHSGTSSANEFLQVEYEGAGAQSVWHRDFLLFSRQRPPYFAQLFGVNRSSLPSLVFHENLIPLSEALRKQENIVFTMIPYEDRPPVAIQMTLSAMILPTDSIRHDTVTSSISWNQNRLIEYLWIRMDHRMLCIGPSTSAADMDFLMPQISLLRSALECTQVLKCEANVEAKTTSLQKGFSSVISLSVPSMISPKSGSEREGDTGNHNLFLVDCGNVTIRLRWYNCREVNGKDGQEFKFRHKITTLWLQLLVESSCRKQIFNCFN